MRGRGSRRILVLGCALALSGSAWAQKYSAEAPVPAGASGKVLSLSGKVLEIRGLSASVGGKTEALNAALRDLGATATATEIRINLASDVLFDFDKDTLKPEATASLQKLVTVLQAHPNASCRIDGYTDSKGNDRYNQALSERRAASVKAWLLAQHVANPMAVQGWGRAKPVAPNTLPDGRDNPAGRQKNRRVEIVIKTG